nr:unnamed protein product [Callosobruchus chinensis]
MAPCDFFLFPHLKKIFKGRHFDSFEDIQESVTRVLGEVPQGVFQNCYENWKTGVCIFSNCFCDDDCFWPYFVLVWHL